MSVPVWVASLAARFWEMAGRPPAYPRCLRRAVMGCLPVAVVELPGLSVASVSEWLRRRGIGGFPPASDRPLHGCMAARGDGGFLLLNADDAEDERRFSLAHELAHFLRDYWLPRERAVKRMGASSVEVLDGVRPATASERLGAMLGRCELSMHVHLMEREEGRPCGSVATAERDADRLAFELLAPAAEALADGEQEPARIVERLQEEFGLPAGAAGRYAAVLMPPEPPGDPLLLRLREAVG